MAYNAADRKDVRAAEKAQAQSLRVRAEVIGGLMSISNGRQWMYERLEEAYAFADPFHHDSHVHAYLGGLRAAGIRMLNDIMNFCPKQFTLMIEEHHGRLAAADERTRKPNGDGRDQGSSPDNGPGYGAEYEYDPNRTEDGDEARVN